MDESGQKIGRYLFYNPWSGAGVIGRLTGLTRHKLEVLEDRVTFARERVPSRDRRGYQDLYALTSLAEKEVAGFSRTERLRGEALLMAYDRLSRARQVLATLAGPRRLVWSISPWRPSRRAPYLDALLALARGQNQASLAGLVVPVKGAGLEWYLEILKAWVGWRRDSSAIPAMLILWNPPLPPGALRYLGQFALRGPQSPVFCIFGDLPRGKSGFTPLEPASQGGEGKPPWQFSSVPTALLLQEAYLTDAGKTKLRIATVARRRAKKDTNEIADALAFFTRARRGEIDTLEMLARFPGLSAWGYNQLNPQKKARRTLSARLGLLVTGGLVEAAAETEGGFPTRYFLTEKGLGFLAGLSGVSAKARNRSLGFPVRPGRFKNEREHLGAILGFILRLQNERVLLAWDFTAARSLFSIVEGPNGVKIRRLIIQPDSSGALLLGGRRFQLFWLELDRGTRRGRSLAWKLEKYFLARYARFASGPIPPLLYLVDTSTGRDESRLRSIARALLRLGEKYPGARVSVLLTTGALLGRASGPLTRARVWRCFTQGAVSPTLISLREAFEKGRK
jgi:hypothetical protein